MTIEENIKARHAAEDIIVWAEQAAEECGERLWIELDKMVWAKVPKKEIENEIRSDSMANKESKLWGQQTRMPFGEWEGKQVDAVPLGRLVWYVDQTFVDELRRYLKSPRIQREQE